MDVGAWLRGLGLGQYEATFRESEIDAEVLPDLTEGDLNQLGMPLGHRKRLLKAIAALGTGETAAKPPSAAPASSPATAERRPITVMFCDLVGSTSMAAKLDAEDWRTLVSAYLDEASAAVTGLGGHVLKKLGDGLMALFGYPHAQENDAERAVRAALAIQRALVEINARNAGRGAPELSARIGLDSGQVVVDATGEVFGDAPNIAARVQGAAEPGSILITAAVQRQTAGLFVAEERGQHELKGLSAPMTLYRIVRASGGGRRGGARALTPLVGREEELDLLTRRWERAHKGEGQLALVVGEPGIGKSRLIEEFRARLGETPHTWTEWSSSQLLQNTPLHPIAEWGRHRFGADLPAEQRLADLESTLGLVGLDPTEYAPLLAPMVDVPLPEDRAAKLAPEELRRRQLAAMAAWILVGARTQAIVLAFEDLHWADPTSLDLMRALAERGAQAPLLIIATARPEFRPPWSVRSHHSAISLSPLDRAQIGKMVRELSSRHALPKDIVEGVSERTGGVPLFVEEVTRLLLERGEQGGAQAIPPTLQQSLAARLDRLGSARETAQIGAVLGRGFSYALLRDVASLDEGALQSALERLAEADILFVEGDGAQSTYRFKHALIQDAAYDSLLKSRRQALHRRAADALVAADAEPEAVAHHSTEAGLDDLAIEWWGKAGDQALRRSAFQEAISHLGKAIALADRAGETKRWATGGAAAPSRGLTQLHVAYGNALIAARGYGAPETTEAFAKARESTSVDKDAPGRLSADYGLWTSSYTRGELPSMRTHAGAFLNDAEASPDSPEAGVAHRAAGITCWFAGEYAQARDHLERALALFQPGRDDDLAFRFGHDAGVGAMLYLAITLWPLGDVTRSIALVESARERLESITHVGARAQGKCHVALFELMRRDHARAAPNAFELVRVAREYNLPFWRASGVFLAGWVSAATGAVGSGLEDMRGGAELLREQNLLWFDGLMKIALAEGETRVGNSDRAIAILDEALATCDRAGYRAFEAELHRARGEMLLERDPANPAPAEAALLTAIAVAKQQGTRTFELRAALSLAKLYQSTGRPAAVYAVLAPALEGFALTPEMPEITEAQTLLAALAETDEVKAEAARRRRMTQLHAAYGNAMILAHGYGARETSAAFERARDTATAEDGFERLSAQYGLWAGSFVRGELGAMRELSAAMLRDCERRPQSGEASIAHRMRGVTHWCAGEFVAARGHLEKAIAIFDPERDGDLAFRFGQDPGIVATAYLAEVLWLLGEVGLADQRMTETTARAVKSGHAATSAYGFFMATHFELIRRNPDRAATFARSLIKIANEHQLPFWMGYSAWFDGWLEWRSGHRKPGLAAMRNSLARQAEQGSVTTFFETLLAEAEAEAGESDVAFCTINHALAASERTELHWYDAETHRIRGEILLKQASSVPGPAEEAFLTAIAVAKQQGTRSFELRAALALAKLYQSTGRPAAAHAVLAPALEGFSPTTEMLEVAEGQALLAALAETDDVKAEASHRQRLTQLHVSCGNALIAARGFGAPETAEAFARARESAAGGKDAPERLAAEYGLWAGDFVRGELPSMRAHSAAFLGDVEARPDSPEAGVAHRAAGITCWVAGEYREARDHLERALALFQPGRDDDLAFRFGPDPGVLAMHYLALILWPMGDIGRAVSLVGRAEARIADLTHVGTLAPGRMHAAMFDLMRGDRARVAPNAFELSRLAREFNLNLFRAFGVFLEGWASTANGASGSRLEAMRRGVELLREQNVLWFDGLLKMALAETESQGGDPEGAIATLDEALGTCDRIGYRAFEAELHRVRGETLLKQNPADPASAEEALLTAIAVAKQQGTRSFELRAALALAKVYQSTARPIEAHAVLAPAPEGFAPTPEMPEIAEARALFAALAETEEVKAEADSRRQRVHLQTSYGKALIGVHGYGAPETALAFERARELATGLQAAGLDDSIDRFPATYGVWVGTHVRGELLSMRELAATFLRESASRPNSGEASVGHRIMGATHWFAAEFVEARAHLEQAVAIFDPSRDADLAFRYGQDIGVSALSYSAIALWPLGEIDLSRRRADEAVTRTRSSGHIATVAYGLALSAIYRLLIRDPEGAQPIAAQLGKAAEDLQSPQYLAFYDVLGGWPAWRSRSGESALLRIRRGIAQLKDQGIRTWAPLIEAMLAEVESEVGDSDSAMVTIARTIAEAERLGQRWYDAELHRIRGEILLKQAPCDPAPAEEAFQAAIAVARQQKTRSFGLRAALALAKLYQSTGRPAEAHAVLAPALEGFSPTREFPEIAEAISLMAAIEAHLDL